MVKQHKTIVDVTDFSSEEIIEMRKKVPFESQYQVHIGKQKRLTFFTFSGIVSFFLGNRVKVEEVQEDINCGLVVHDDSQDVDTPGYDYWADPEHNK